VLISIGGLLQTRAIKESLFIFFLLNIMFTVKVLPQKVNKHLITSIDLCYVITKKTTASVKNP
jgi:hypothetical protein